MLTNDCPHFFFANFTASKDEKYFSLSSTVLLIKHNACMYTLNFLRVQQGFTICLKIKTRTCTIFYDMA